MNTEAEAGAGKSSRVENRTSVYVRTAPVRVTSPTPREWNMRGPIEPYGISCQWHPISVVLGGA